MPTTVPLPTILRNDTADLHRRVEGDVGLPDSVHTRGDYVALLRRLHGFHSMVETMWLDPQWDGDWLAVEIDVDVHLRTRQLALDLAELGVHSTPIQAPELGLRSFGGVLGSLYVVEGSALGGRVLAPHLRAAAGDVPTSFFDSAGRNHPQPWRAVKAALCAYEEAAEDFSSVIEGARVTFRAFGIHVGRSTWSERP